MIALKTRVRVLLNRHSGASEDRARQIVELFRENGVECEVELLERGSNVRAAARAVGLPEPISGQSETVIVAAGGDGTVGAVAQAVADTGRPMGVLPVGTLNHFAKDLGLPLDLAGAVQVASGQATVAVDAGEVNGHIFVNNSSLGFYPGLVLERERLRRVGWNKWLSLSIASVMAFFRFRHIRVRFEADGVKHACMTPFLFVGNNEYRVNGMRMGTREHLDRGKLFLYVAPGAKRLDLLRFTLAALAGHTQQTPCYEVYCLTEFTVDAHKRRMRVSLDGEVLRLKGPLVYRIRPGALRVLCERPLPEDTQDSGVE